jgi:hypothetical protein
MLDEVLRSLQHGPGGTLELSSGALAGFQARALAIEQGEELYRLVDDLVGLASLLDGKRGSPAAARALMTMVEPVVVRLEALARADGEKSSRRRDELRRRIDEQKRGQEPSRGPGAAIAGPSGVGVGLRKGRR